MVEVRWTDESLADMEEIAKFISKDSPRYAGIQVQRFFDHAVLLETQPYLGRMVPELEREDVRELILGSYRLISA